MLITVCGYLKGVLSAACEYALPCRSNSLVSMLAWLYAYRHG
jgi:hypothetical protein